MIDPWGNIEIGDYEKAFSEFGLTKFPSEWASKLNHYLFTRNIIIAHRDFEKVMQRIKEKKPFIQMTGVASSGKLHLGHKINLDLFKFFKTKGARTYLCIANIDAYVSRPKIQNMDEANEYAVNNLAHILAYGFTKKDIYLQSKKDNVYYTFTFELSKKITEAMFRAVYGHLDLGKASANMLQYADILHPQLKEYEGKMPSVTSIGLDQDPHAKLTRDIAKRINYDIEMPSFLYFRHQGGLQKGIKMSSSNPYSAIYLDDELKDIKYKIDRSFTGGRDTLEEQKKKGGQPDICRIYDLYKFHHPNDRFVVNIYTKCRKGKILCKECKEKCVNFLNNMLNKHQRKVKKYLPIARKMVFG
jgi:tryptophanyl-tRNA synthetase